MAELTWLLSRRYWKGVGIDFREQISLLKEHNFELAFLVLLTLEGVKPLSRWERILDSRYLDIIEELGLSHRFVPRKVQIGESVTEIIFGRSEELLDSYSDEFASTPISKTAVTRRKEGALFGYPECCVEHFVKKPYDLNQLTLGDQRILFHWACPGCERTAELLPRYRGIHQWLMNLQ
jgi:hypothetical protein